MRARYLLLVAVIASVIAGASCGSSTHHFGCGGPSGTRTCTAPAFVYATTNGTGQVLIFPVSASGQLTTASALPGPAIASGVAVSFSMELFVADHIQSTLYAYVKNFDNTYSPAPGSPYQVAVGGLALEGIAVTPDGKFVYVAGVPGIYGFSVATDGSLTPIPGSPFPAPGYKQPTVDGSAKFLFAANASSLTGFTIDPNTGALTSTGQVVPLPSNSLPTAGMALVAPGTNFIYVAQSSTNSVAAFSFDTASGLLTAVNGSPFSAGALPLTVTASEAGTVYSVNSGDGTISALSLNRNTGALTPVSGSPFTAPDAGGNAAILFNQFLYVSSINNISNPPVHAILGYQLGANGALTPLSGSPFMTSTQLWGGLATF